MHPSPKKVYRLSLATSNVYFVTSDAIGAGRIWRVIFREKERLGQLTLSHWTAERHRRTSIIICARCFFVIEHARLLQLEPLTEGHTYLNPDYIYSSCGPRSTFPPSFDTRPRALTLPANLVSPSPSFNTSSHQMLSRNDEKHNAGAIRRLLQVEGLLSLPDNRRRWRPPHASSWAEDSTTVNIWQRWRWTRGRVSASFCRPSNRLSL